MESPLLDVLKCFFGGLDFEFFCSQPYWLLLYCLFLIFFELLFYLPAAQKQNVRIICCTILLSFILLLKLFFYIIRICTKFSVDFDMSTEQAIDSETTDQSPPSNIPENIWNLRHLLVDNQRSPDQVVSDLINSGVDTIGILNLAEYIFEGGGKEEIERARSEPKSIDESQRRQQIAIRCCNRIHILPFSLHQIDQIYPSSPSLISILFSVVFGYSSAYLSLSLGDQFVSREKWFLAIILSSSTFSIVRPPAIDPYNTSINDCWNSCSRPLFISILCSIWRIILDFVCTVNDSDKCQADTMVISQIYNAEIDWNVILPYIFDVLHYGLLLSPFFMFVGNVGHPVSTIVAILESDCRYCFGQNGVSGILHLIVQILRGSISVAAAWGILNIDDGGHDTSDTSDTIIPSRKFYSTMICVAIAASTLINLIPLILNRALLSKWVSTFLFPIIAAIISFLITYIFTVVIHNNYDVIKWFCLSWLSFFEIIIPFLHSCHRMFCCHYIILPFIRFIPIFRYISSLIVSPLFLASSLEFVNTEHPLPVLLIAFIITHATQKMNCESHYYAFAVIIAVAIFPHDFGLNDPIVNIFLSLLIASKIEVMLPTIVAITHNRYSQLIMDELFEVDDFPLIVRFIISVWVNIKAVMPDNLVKIPTLFWCVLTGGEFLSQWGVSYVLLPQPMRPNYFFDWPNNANIYKKLRKSDRSSRDYSMAQRSLIANAFDHGITNHPIETPIYMSAVRSIAKSLGPWLKSGRMGHISAGNMYLFISKGDSVAFFLHVISIEPTSFKFQLRGLEYKSQTACHQGELTQLTEVIDEYNLRLGDAIDYEEFLNLNAAFYASASVADLRTLQTELDIYNASPTEIGQAFVGLSHDQIVLLFIYSFAFVIRKAILCVSDQDSSILEDHDESNRLLHSNTGFELINNLKAAINSLNEICQMNMDSYQTFLQPLQPLFVSIMNCALDNIDSSFSESLFIFFSHLAAFAFNENGRLKLDQVSLNFNGDFSNLSSEILDWYAQFPNEIENSILLPFFQYAYIFCFLSSSGLLDLNQNENENENQTNSNEVTMEVFNEVYDQMVDIELSYVIAPINSQKWLNEFILAQKMILTIVTSRVLRFSFAQSSWSIFQINHEYARALWGNEARDVLFLKDDDEERLAIQQNSYFLNNLIIQSCELPIGYPAYTSEIFEAYYNPLLPENLILPP